MIIDGLELFKKDLLEQFCRSIRDNAHKLRFVVASTGDTKNMFTKQCSDGKMIDRYFIGDINKTESIGYLTNVCQIKKNPDACMIYELFGGSLFNLNDICINVVLHGKDGFLYASQLFTESLEKIHHNYRAEPYKSFLQDERMIKSVRMLLDGDNSIYLFDR